MRWTDESCTGKGMGVADSGVRNIGMRRLACGAALALALVTAAGGTAVSPRPARAEPWAPVNDIQLKNDITTLKEYGIIPGSVTTWPIPWAAISGALARAQGQAYPPHVMAAIARVRAKMPKRADFRRPKASAEAMGTNRARLVRDFGGGARGDFDSRVAVERHWASAYARLAVNFRDDPVDPHDINLDGSYGAVALGNWMLFGGRVEQWWGPGWDACDAADLEQRPRPLPVVGLGQARSRSPSRRRWLRWIGPWNLRALRRAHEQAQERFRASLAGAGYRESTLRRRRWLSLGPHAAWCSSAARAAPAVCTTVRKGR
ncbi:MAG: hypothetical protein KatS3mg082_2421 [Nitrospiraceae bacterium]|nr:MAG: hypothetical protein KatS3mg082_2421 [Nitrospiraceae bacterium]